MRGLVLLVLLLATAATTARTAAEEKEETVIYAGRMFDSRSGRVLVNQVITVVDGVVVNVTASVDESRARVYAQEEGRSSTKRAIIDLGNAFVLPGLIDAHVHLFLRPYNIVDWNTQVTQESIPQRVLRAGMYAKRTLMAGFTAVRDLGTEGAEDADQDLKRAIDQGWVEGPRLYIASRAIVSTGSYPPKGFNYHQYVGAEVADGVEEMRKVVRRQLNYGGADWIKLYGDYSRYHGKYYPNFNIEEIQTAVNEAAEVGAHVAVHAKTPQAILRAVQAGVKSIEHGTNANDEALIAMRERDVVLCPTLTIYEAAAQWNPDDVADFETSKNMVRRALELNVPVVMGSDAGGIENGDNMREIELYVSLGMSTIEALRATTIRAAELIAPNDGLGSIDIGTKADIIAVEGDPLDNISDLRNIVFVMKGGKVFRDDSGSVLPCKKSRCVV